MSKIELGTITKPQGLKGDFRVKPAFNNYDILNDIKTIFINEKEYSVKKLTIRDGFVIYKVDGIDDCNVVENLRNTKIYFEEFTKETLPQGEYYVSDLVGMKIYNDSNGFIGTLTEINQYGSADVFSVSTEKGEILFPFARDVIVSVNYDKKIIIVNQNILDEIVV